MAAQQAALLQESLDKNNGKSCIDFKNWANIEHHGFLRFVKGIEFTKI